MRSRRTRRARAGAALLASALVLGALTALTFPSATQAAVAAPAPCGVGGNKIACENTLPGSPSSQWDIDGAGDASIQGFSTDISVNVGQRIDFKIDTNASAYTITIYRSGYYGGDGARKIATVTPSASLPQNQPACISDITTELYDCGNWAVSASWNVPSTAVSGVYFAHLQRADRNDESHITFIVRDDSSHSDLVFQTADPTWQAYNNYGGSNFYRGGANGRAYKLSYNRPMLTRGGPGGRDFYFANEYPMVRFLERNGYDVSYIAGVDTDRAGILLRNHKTFLSVGHDEYWSKAQRANVEAARAAGVNLMFLAGNEVYWKTRYEPSADPSATPYRTLVSYKETWADSKIDPSEEWTGTWRDPRYAPRSRGGGVPENALTGTMYMVNDDDLAVTVSAEEGKRRLWRNTTLASLPAGGSRVLAPHTIGYESNEDVDNGFRPEGLIRLSTTTGPTPQYLQDFGNTVAEGTTTHHLTMYRAASGALVFSAGSVQWTWGLDPTHDSPYTPEPADVRMQQAQVNLLADMDAQPTTLMSGLVAATKSTDTTGPTATIIGPPAGASPANGSRVTASGTATDTGGGVVGGVEVSSDGGATWHPATGTTSWTYTYVQHGVGATPLQVRAVDDSANIGPTTTRSLAVRCSCSVFGATDPATPAVTDPSAVELGLRFTPMVGGFVTGVRFYKGVGNTGTHVGSLWTTGGQRLASVTFGNESAAGWQEASFSTPVEVVAGQTYVVSYTAPNGHYAVKSWAFSAGPIEAHPLAVDGGFGATAAGVYSDAGRFPDRSTKSTNYYVDALFTTTDESPLVALDQKPLPGASSVPAGTTVSARLSKPVVSGSAGITLEDSNGNAVIGATAYDEVTRTVTFTPTQALAGFVTYTATVRGTDSLGNQVSTGRTWSFTTAKPPAQPGVCPCTLFDDSTQPAVLEANDTALVTLGVRFSTDVDGTVSGVRFYKGPNNTGTHVGALWTAGGTQLASGTFEGESSSGWQTLTFAAPVEISKATDYVVSYRAPVGRYSVTVNGFSDANLSRPPLLVSSQAGSYVYGTGFPGNRASHNYLVDPVFEKAAPTLAIVARDPAPGALDVPRGSSIRVWFSNPIQSGWSMPVTVAGAPVAGSASLSANGKVLTFTPSGLLPRDAEVQVSLSGVRSTEGASLPTQAWSYRTSPASDFEQPQTIFGDRLPAVESANEGSPVELGVVFQANRPGRVSAIRFLKGTGNDGVHKGSLWAASGELLASVVFTNETPSGWQTARLSTPVRLVPGETYVASYLAPQGHYSYTSGLFYQPITSDWLTAPSGDNGRYLYGAAGGLPAYSYNSSGYFVDVLFVPDPPEISLVGQTPGAGATGVSRATRVSASFSAPVRDGYVLNVSVVGGGPVSGTTVLSADRKRVEFTPTAQLPADTTIRVNLSSVVSTEGAELGAQEWTFRTEVGSTILASLFAGVTPTVSAVNDKVPIELGVSFVPATAGEVTGLKFYKGTGNTGTHVGSLWSSTGVLLARATFTGETSGGWQTVSLSSPVSLTPGTTYVVSYYAPKGQYSATAAFFGSDWVSGPLTASRNGNGRYRYGSGGGFPTSSYNATNYFVDLVYRTTAP